MGTGVISTGSYGVSIHIYHPIGLMIEEPNDYDALFFELDDWVYAQEQKGFEQSFIINILKEYVDVTKELEEEIPVDIFRPEEEYVQL